MKKPLSRQALKLIADRFKLLSCSTRLELLQYLCERERTVTELVNLTGFKQANVSRSLCMLDRAGLVRRRAEGTHVYYALAEKSLPALCQMMQDGIRTAQGRALACL